MSDSHDNVDAIKKAVRFFNSSQCELVLHAGDFIAPFAAREMGQLSCTVKAVFGNCDGEKKGLKKVFVSLGEIEEEPFVFSHADRNILLTHTQFANEKHIRSGKYDAVIYGHTHKPDVRMSNGITVLNPGETGGWLTGKNSVALLDPVSLDAEIVYL
ncbi:MAG: metallophosphoesterase [Candidatus Aminicenantes bacterium]